MFANAKLLYNGVVLENFSAPGIQQGYGGLTPSGELHLPDFWGYVGRYISKISKKYPFLGENASTNGQKFPLSKYPWYIGVIFRRREFFLAH